MNFWVKVNKLIIQKFIFIERMVYFMPKLIEINERFSHWVVLEDAPNHISPGGTSRKMYKCRCDCGTIKEVSAT
jgi:hypothetical protein